MSRRPDPKARQRPVFSLTGADLAITTDLDTLLRPSGSLLTVTGAQVGAYGLGLLPILLALLARRRARTDPPGWRAPRPCVLSGRPRPEARTITEMSAALRQMVATAGIRPPPLPAWTVFWPDATPSPMLPAAPRILRTVPCGLMASLLADQLLKEVER